MHQSSMSNMTSFKERFLCDKLEETLNVLDIGSCDVNGSYRAIFDEPTWKYVGADMSPGKNVDIVFKNPYRWCEVKSNSIDVLLSGQAFEHIELYWLTMLEVFRVLKPGGICCLIAPSTGPEHRFPVDCWRFLPDGFKALARFASMHTIETFIQDEDRAFTDGSEVWHDTVFIGEKPLYNLAVTQKIRLKHFLLRRLFKP